MAGPAERYLLDESYDLIINVVDASRLGRSLELTLQLLGLGRPMIVALNMMDEARRRGIEIDHQELSKKLGVPVVTTISRFGRGLKPLFRESLRHAVFAQRSTPPTYDLEIEQAIGSSRCRSRTRRNRYPGFPPGWLPSSSSRATPISRLEPRPDVPDSWIA